MSLWDDDENQEFRDIPDETGLDENGQPKSSPHQRVQQQAAPQPVAQQIPFNGAAGRFEEPSNDNYVDDLVEEIQEEEEDLSDLFQDANLRIEQGRLYQMLISHDIFEGMDADPRAVANVQKEIRKVARERMEIMLGMRQEQGAQPAMVSSPFNDLEVSILKMVASKASGGATESPEANQVAAAVKEVPKRKTLTPISGSTGLKKQATPQAPQRSQPQQKQAPQRALPQQPKAPIQRTKMDQTIDQICAEEGISRADLELEYVGIGKKIGELTAEELAQRQKIAASRSANKKSVKSASAIPMATPEQQEMLAMSRANQFKGVGKMDGLPIPGGMSALLDKVKSMPIKNQE